MPPGLPSTPPDVLPNVRDVGGLPTTAGRLTRAGVLLRSAAPHPGDRPPDAVPWPPTDVLDLRSPMETAGRAHPLASARTQVHVLPLVTAVPTPSARAGSAGQDRRSRLTLGTVYVALLDLAAPHLVRALDVATRARGPVLVHCAAGKDRTGITVAALLSAAGVTREAIVADYAETARHLDAIYAREPVRAEGADPAYLQTLLGAPPEAIGEVLDRLDAARGGAAGWFASAGASRDDLAAWRARLVA